MTTPSAASIRRSRLAFSLVAALVALIVAAPPAVSAGRRAAPATAASATVLGSSGKLRNGLPYLVAHPAGLDPALPTLLAGYQFGELPVFALLGEPNDATHRAVLRDHGARILRHYRSVPLVAILATPAEVRSIAQISWVRLMVPIEVTHELDQPMVDQS